MIYLLPHLIEAAAQRDPDRIAVSLSGQKLSFGVLSRLTNGLARVLIDQGVKRRDRVGIYMNKSLESVVAMYGIMKAGAAYVPLDLSAPKSRLHYTIRDCGIKCLISEPSQATALTQIFEAGVQCVIGVGPEAGLATRPISWQEVDNFACDVAPQLNAIDQDLAYIMYTSGSTGNPKGMMHTHHSGLSYARWAAGVYGLHHEDRLSNHAPLHFDLSTFDFFAGALAGATTVIVPEGVSMLPASYSKWLQDEKISVFFTVPFALTQLLLRGALQVRDLSAMRWIIFGGEPFPPKHLCSLMNQLPHAQFSNMYGPAEVNGCTYFHIPKSFEDTGEPIPIGKVCPNSEMMVVDANDKQVSEGQVGELLIRSATMMQGYWGRPDLNQKAFYCRRVVSGYQEVFFRTGDLVQIHSDGNLRFLGRKDRQIKTRGYRVELDEVEAAMLSHDQIIEMAVFAVPDEGGSHQIHGVVILKKDSCATPSDLIKHVSHRLPKYAVPTKVTIVDSFPRTSSGKINRRVLQDQV